MEDHLRPLDRGGEGRRVEEVAADGFSAEGAQGLGLAVAAAEAAHGVAVAEELGHERPPEESGGAGDEDGASRAGVRIEQGRPRRLGI